MRELWERFVQWLRYLFSTEGDEDDAAYEDSQRDEGPITPKELAVLLCEEGWHDSMEHYDGRHELPCIYQVGVSESDYNNYYAARKRATEAELTKAIAQYTKNSDAYIHSSPQVHIVIDTSVWPGNASIKTSFEPVEQEHTEIDTAGKNTAGPSSVTPPPIPKITDTDDQSNEKDAKDQKLSERTKENPEPPRIEFVAEVIANSGRAFPVRGNEETIGIIRRDEGKKPDIPLEYGADKNLEFCSQIHGKFVAEGDGVWSYVSQSAHNTSTILRGNETHELCRDQSIVLQDGDRIALGSKGPSVTFKVRQVSSVVS